MSGFAGLIHLDGAPVNRRWLEAMADSLRLRGPDGSQIQGYGEAGLCHALLRLTPDQETNSQWCQSDGISISGDIRIDDRQTLLLKLKARAAREFSAASDAELILHAYDAWGEQCVEHILGDFSFVLWDSRRHCLFCARDHLGIRPLYYAEIGQCLLVSNTLDCLRQLDAVPTDLNDRAIGDFLMSGLNQDPESTFFQSIRRVPPAHFLSASANGIRLQRYWRLPVDEPLHYRRQEDYVERFQELLRTAVSDRLIRGPVGIFMSGGLDSPLLAAATVNVVSSVAGACPVAFTDVYDRLIPHEERFYAGLVAAHLGIPIHYRVIDDEPFGWDPQEQPIHTPEPAGDVLNLKAERDYWRRISSCSRVFFYGEGPDNALRYEWRPYLAYLIQRRSWWRLAHGLAAHVAAHRRVPLLTTIPRMWREKRARAGLQPSFPKWIDEDLVRRLGLRERWVEVNSPANLDHPVRPGAYSSFHDALWLALFDRLDGAAWFGVPVEVRHPFLDLRLLRYLLAVPAVPWCRIKYLMRCTARDVLPEPVRRRAKAPLSGDPTLEKARSQGLPHLATLPMFSRYVDNTRLPEVIIEHRAEFWRQVWAWSLHYWLSGLK